MIIIKCERCGKEINQDFDDASFYGYFDSIGDLCGDCVSDYQDNLLTLIQRTNKEIIKAWLERGKK